MAVFSGTYIPRDSLYSVYIFNSSGIFTPSFTGNVEVLVVAGGGGGGMDMGGGGGGGGVISNTSYAVTAGVPLAITVGAGGYGAPAGSGGYRGDGVGPQPGGHQFTVSATNGNHSYIGQAKIVDGNFNLGITGWGTYNSTVTWYNGTSLRSTSLSGNPAGTTYYFSTVPGRRYYYRADVSQSGGISNDARIQISGIGLISSTGQSTVTGTKTIYDSFVASSTTHILEILLYNSQAGAILTVDDVAIYDETSSSIAIGGGYGGSSYYGYTPNYGLGGSGGSGGGSSGYTAGATTIGASGTAGQGYKGGNAGGGSYYSGGGGGAGGAGADGPNQPNGGPGVLNQILEKAYYWGGGGGGASYSSGQGGNGGVGGGGGGANGTTTGGAGYNNGSAGGGGAGGSWANTPGGSGGQYTGGGGGGGSHYNATNQGGNGGSGIVIIRHLRSLGIDSGVVGNSPSSLVCYYDMNNTQKSYKGAPVTNLLPTPTINSIPTTGNGWGTYNTNQYGSGAYFSIGTVSSVSGNIVTMSAAHSLRSYDVMQPQTTGGGVTAGTNYLIKKLSSTTFSLHAYNSSQDGSQGYINPATGTHKVYDDFANDVRISINSSSFPTMWWGYPHLPNSGLVKEVRTNGCSIPGFPTTDCLRLYHTRPDGVTDGMAYGVDATVTANTAHTVSFWTKTVNSAAVGQSISYQIYNYGVVSPAGYSFSATLGPVGVWVKQSMTFTPVNPYCISYFFPSSGNIIYDLAHIQFEAGSVANHWTNSSRSATQVLLDVSGNTIITPTNLTYASDGTFSFGGTSKLEIPISGNPTLYGFQVAIKNYKAIPPNTNMAPYYSAIGFTANGYSTIGLNVGDWTGSLTDETISFWHYGAAQGATSIRDTISFDWHIYSINWNGSSYDIWIDGSKKTTYGFGTLNLITNLTKISVGYNEGWNYWFSGNIASLSVYNRQLSDSEVQQNFNAIRSRYGL